ncbi:MAG: 4-(cytidine 5'-diphospho)-2-C-methyl-D-erythritol kinase [Clostridia bacterium]
MIHENACAKINLGLDILGKRSDGYHDIDTIMQSISLCDRITLEIGSGINICCNDSSIPAGRTNTAYIAAETFLTFAGINSRKTGVNITIEKNIPSCAGLGGGSSDAAAVLRGLNKLHCTNYGSEKLQELALDVGSDVPFCVLGGTQRALGRGEELRILPDFDNVSIVVIMPGEIVDTGYAYSLYSAREAAVHPDMDKVEKALNERDFKLLSLFLANTFEEIVFPEKPAIAMARHDMLNMDPDAALMTGSGSAVYGIYEKPDKALAAYDGLCAKYTAYLTKTTGRLI